MLTGGVDFLGSAERETAEGVTRRHPSFGTGGLSGTTGDFFLAERTSSLPFVSCHPQGLVGVVTVRNLSAGMCVRESVRACACSLLWRQWGQTSPTCEQEMCERGKP